MKQLWFWMYRLQRWEGVSESGGSGSESRPWDPDSVVPCSAALTGPWQQGTTEYLTLSALCCLSFLAVLKCFHENRIWSTVSDPSLLTCRWILNRSSYLALHVWTMAVHWVKIDITTIKNPFFAFLPRELSCYIAVLLTFPLLKSLIYK